MALGVPDASCSAYMASIPTMSVSQALGIRLFDIMLMMVQGTTPKNSCMAVQHCTEVPFSSLACIHSSTTTPNLAILVSEICGVGPLGTYWPMFASFSFTG